MWPLNNEIEKYTEELFYMNEILNLNNNKNIINKQSIKDVLYILNDKFLEQEENKKILKQQKEEENKNKLLEQEKNFKIKKENLNKVSNDINFGF